jgi:hypothetical protein
MSDLGSPSLVNLSPQAPAISPRTVVVGVVVGVALALGAYGLGFAPTVDAKALGGSPTALVPARSAQPSCEAGASGGRPAWRG